MAETAKILSPDKMVLIPAEKAGCSLAESITAEDVRQLRQKYPGVPVVTYVNTYADVKAETDVCCTSGNAAKVVQSMDADKIIFLPDEYLAKNVAKETGKKIIFPSKKPVSENKASESPLEYDFIGWHGKCEVHEQFTVKDIENVRKQFPDVLVLAHPECSPEVVDASDYSGSTSRMIEFVRESQAERYLLLTECSMGDNIIAENPDKEMVRMCSIRCPHMNEITLEDTLTALQNDQYQIHVPEDLRIKAKKSIDRMLEYS
jgi:quinolinate synthase